MSANMMLRAGLLALVVSAAVACGGSSNKGNHDAGPSAGDDLSGPATSPPDLSPPPCVMDPVSGNDFLNACTTAQTGDPAKNYPYFPKLAPNGNLPPTN